MKSGILKPLCPLVAAMAVASAALADPYTPIFEWTTVVNNNDLMPPQGVRNFNSYNQPSVNTRGMVVIRARSRGGPPFGPPTHGIYMRDMGRTDSDIVRVLDRTKPVPRPNNLGSTFVETPSFPRIDMHSDTIATRGNHPPVFRYLEDDDSETRAGTTGIYVYLENHDREQVLVTGAAKLGHVPGFGLFGVPEQGNVAFEVFPGSPSVTNASVIAFKGNYSAGGAEKTGVYFRRVRPAPGGGTEMPVLIANTDTLSPGTLAFFGSTAPPNAAAHHVVFAGFDDEASPTLGGIYLAPLQYQPPLTTLVSIGQRVPGDPDQGRFNALGKGIAFDGRYVGFWGAWGEGTRTLRLYCPNKGNKDRIAYCNQALVCSDSGETMGDPRSVCDDVNDPNVGKRCYQEREVPINQGIFVHDTRTKSTRLVARTADRFDDFVFWNYSGKPPCSGKGHSEEGGADDAHSVRWRSSAFLAVSSAHGATFRTAFKARRIASPVGVYLATGPGHAPVRTVIETSMPGRALDPEAPGDAVILEVGIEREGLRGRWLAINAKMGVDGGEEEDDDIAGIYITQLGETAPPAGTRYVDDRRARGIETVLRGQGPAE